MSMQFAPLLHYGFYYLVQGNRKVKGYKKLKAESYSEMLRFGSDVDVFPVKNTTQEICNFQNKNETNTTTTFTIKHDKF
jgi:hypothetical protein